MEAASSAQVGGENEKGKEIAAPLGVSPCCHPSPDDLLREFNLVFIVL